MGCGCRFRYSIHVRLVVGICSCFVFYFCFGRAGVGVSGGGFCSFLSPPPPLVSGFCLRYVGISSSQFLNCALVDEIFAVYSTGLWF